MAEQGNPTDSPGTSVQPAATKLAAAAADDPLPELPQPSVSERFLALFNELRIKKIVLVDDRLEKPLDAALITRVFSETPPARDAAAHYFPGIELAEENDNLFEQIDAFLDQLDANQRSELGATLAVFDKDAADIKVADSLRELMPADFPIEFLTPAQWMERRDALVGECSTTARTLFLFDQDLGAPGEEGATKGTSIIGSLAQQDRAAFGTRWFCGLLSHTLDKGAEVSTWRALSVEEGLSLELFMPISKQNLSDGDAFYGAVYRTVINIYTEKMKKLAQDAFECALQDALEEFANLDPIDFEHMVVKSSDDEGVSELETLLRLYSIVQRDRVKKELLKQTRLPDFLDSARTVKKVVDVARALPEAASKRLAKLRVGELYEAGDLINEFRDPLRNGDLFEIGSGSSLKLWVLIAQPCDLMVRTNGKRSYEDNFKVAVLAPIKKGRQPPEIKPGLEFALERFDHEGTQPAFVIFAEATPVELRVLDLAVLRPDGKCEIDSTTTTRGAGFASLAWDARAKRVKQSFKDIATKVEKLRESHGDERANELASYLLPPAAPAAAFRKHGTYDKGQFAYKITRWGRVREPFATSLLAAFSRYMSRDAHEHDFSAVRLD